MTTPLPSDGYFRTPLTAVHGEVYFYCRFSAFRHYAAAYSEDLLDRLALLTYIEVTVDWEQEPYFYWIMDCQDYYDLELLLDATGNLDAPI